MPKESKKIKEFRRWRAKEDLKLSLWRFLDQFESKEEPKVDLTRLDKASVMNEIVGKILNHEDE